MELGGDYYDRQNKPRTVARLVARLAKLGYHAELREMISSEGETEPIHDPTVSRLDGEIVPPAPKAPKSPFHLPQIVDSPRNVDRETGWMSLFFHSPVSEQWPGY